MDKVTSKLQVFFEDPFWVGIFERMEVNRLSVCKVTFGSEPKDYEVHDYVLKNYDRLCFSPSVEHVVQDREKLNPKRRQREVRKQLDRVGIGTKSQQALQLLREQSKLVRKVLTREQKEAEAERQFAMKQQKKREKHKGR
jgi:hypothetical protein